MGCVCVHAQGGCAPPSPSPHHVTPRGQSRTLAGPEWGRISEGGTSTDGKQVKTNMFPVHPHQAPQLAQGKPRPPASLNTSLHLQLVLAHLLHPADPLPQLCSAPWACALLSSRSAVCHIPLSLIPASPHIPAVSAPVDQVHLLLLAALPSAGTALASICPTSSPASFPHPALLSAWLCYLAQESWLVPVAPSCRWMQEGRGSLLTVLEI